MSIRAEFVLLRFLSIVLAGIDTVFNVHWGQRALDRMASRWQARLEQLDQSLAHLEHEREQLQLQAEAIALHVATFRLGGRTLSGEQLRFDPADSGDERILDAAIDLLVKSRLATVGSEEIEPGRFIYILEPDWAAIHARIREAAGRTNTQAAEMFQESLRFIEENLLSPTTALDRQPPAPSAETGSPPRTAV